MRGARKFRTRDGDAFVVDAEDAGLASAHTWHVAVHSGRPYVVTNVRRDDGTQTRLYLHRLVSGAKDGERVVLRDRDGTNCRKSNLIVKALTSRHPGVSLERGMWKAHGCEDGEQVYLGLYRTEREAARARRRWEMGRGGSE